MAILNTWKMKVRAFWMKYTRQDDAPSLPFHGRERYKGTKIRYLKNMDLGAMALKIMKI